MTANPQMHETLPGATATFLTDTQTWMLQEEAKRFTDQFVPFVVTGGLGATAAGLTHTPTALTAYPGGYYTTESGSITYPNNAVTWVVATYAIDSPLVGSFSRVAGTKYAIDSVSAVQPTAPANSVWLMKVTTAGGAITAVVDLRTLSPITAGNVSASTVLATGSTTPRTLASWFADSPNAVGFSTAGYGTLGSPWTGFETALNALSAGAHIHFPTGYYALSAKLAMKDRWAITGDGSGTVLKVGTLNDDMLYATGVSDLSVRNLQLDATGQTGSDSHAIRIINGSNLLIDGVYAHHAANDNIRLGPSGSAAGTVLTATITNSILTYAGQVGPAGNAIGATDFQYLVVSNNQMGHNAKCGMDLEPTWSTHNAITRVVISGNDIYSNSGDGINLYNSTADVNNGEYAIVGNGIWDNAGSYAIQLAAQANVAVVGNMLKTSIRGLYIWGASQHITVTGNTIAYMSNAGVYVSGASTYHTVVVGNDIHDCGTGVLEADNADYTDVGNNHFAANGTDVTLIGAHSHALYDLYLIAGVVQTPFTYAGNGTGAAATLGNIGGAGRPATAAMGGWIKMILGDSAAVWVPFWQ